MISFMQTVIILPVIVIDLLLAVFEAKLQLPGARGKEHAFTKGEVLLHSSRL